MPGVGAWDVNETGVWMMAKRGRPQKYDDARIAELVEKLKQYIEETEIPIIAEFAALNGLYKQFFYDHEEFSDLIKIAISKKEAALERGALSGTLNPTMAVFSLKQMGWRDKHEIDQNIANKDGKPFEVQHSVDLKKLSADELRQLEALLSKVETDES